MHLKIVLAAFVVFSFIAFGAFADNPFNSDSEAYEFGYKEGHQHGMADFETGLDFNYRHAHRFRSGISFNSYVDDDFRSGYIDGYTDGFYARSDRSGTSSFRSAPEFRSVPSEMGSITVFTKSKFDGYHRSFEVGEYPELDDDWDDVIDSIRVSGPLRVILFDEEDFKGARLIIESNTADLGDLNFDSRAESMIVEFIR